MKSQGWWRTCLKILRKILVVLFLVSFVWVTTSVLLGWALVRVVTNPASYDKVMQPACLDWILMK